MKTKRASFSLLLLILSLLFPCGSFSASASEAETASTETVFTEQASVLEDFSADPIQNLLWTDTGDEFQIQLSEEQQAGISDVYYTVFRKTTTGLYSPLLSHCTVQPDETGVLHISKEQHVFVLNNILGTPFLCPFTQLDASDDSSVWQADAFYLTDNAERVRVDLQVTLPAQSVHDSDASDSPEITVLAPYSSRASYQHLFETAAENWDSVLYSYSTMEPACSDTARILPFPEWPLYAAYRSSVTVDDTLSFQWTSTEALPYTFWGQAVLEYADGTVLTTDLMEFSRDTDCQSVFVDTPEGSLEFFVYPDHAEIRSYEGTDLSLEVPAVVSGVPVTSVKTSAFGGCSSLESLFLPDSIVQIQKNAFAECSSLKEIHLPQQLTILDDSVFYNCSQLTEIHLPDGIRSVGKYAFERCTALEEISFPASVSYIGNGVLTQCISLTRITLDPSNTTYCMKEDSLMTANGKMLLASQVSGSPEIRIPEGTELIAFGAFAGFSHVTAVVFPDSVLEIQPYAFFNTSIEAFQLPKQLEYIGCLAFSYSYDFSSPVPEIQTISVGKDLRWYSSNAIQYYLIYEYEVDRENPVYTVKDGMLLTKDGTLLKRCPTGRSGSLTLPEGITDIAESAFGGNGLYLKAAGNTSETAPGITSLVLPDSLSYLDGYYLPSSLESLAFGAGIQSTESLQRLYELKEVSVPEENPYYSSRNGILYSRDQKVLVLYPSQKTDYFFAVPNTVEKIEETAISSNRFLKSLSIPASLTDTEGFAYALSKFPALESITVSADNPALQMTDDVLYTKDGIELLLYTPERTDHSYTVPEGTLRISPWAFSSNYDLQKLYLPSTLEPMTPNENGELPLHQLYSLEYVEVSEENAWYFSRDGLLYTKEDQSLVYCPSTSLETISLAEGTRSVQDAAFQHTDSLCRVYFPDGLLSIGGANFNYIDSKDQWDLIDIWLPDSLQSISEDSFQDSPGIVFHCSSGSAAETFALEHGITCISE